MLKLFKKYKEKQFIRGYIWAREALENKYLTRQDIDCMTYNWIYMSHFEKGAQHAIYEDRKNYCANVAKNSECSNLINRLKKGLYENN